MIKVQIIYVKAKDLICYPIYQFQYYFLEIAITYKHLQKSIRTKNTNNKMRMNVLKSNTNYAS